MKGLILKKENWPQVIVIDKDNTLLNTIAVVFPTSKYLLCQSHCKECEGKVKVACTSKNALGFSYGCME